MLKGRDLCGLPIFSWSENICIGRVADFYIDCDTKALMGIGLKKNLSKKKYRFIRVGDILKVYCDGVVIVGGQQDNKISIKKENIVSYHDFMARVKLFLREGEIVTDIIFNTKLEICGYEISGGVWEDLTRGRKIRRCRDKIEQISR